jgi:uncharacterized protein
MAISRFRAPIILLLLLVASPAILLAQADVSDVPVPTLTRYATDLTVTLTASQVVLLNQKLENFEKETSTQIVVLMIPTIGSAAIEEYALRVAEKNKIGREGKDNGALLLVAKDDRKIRIEVGYGLEGALPDALSGTIIRREIGPKFREGDFFGGLNAGVEAIMLATKNEYKADPKDEGRGVTLTTIFFLIFVILIISRMFISRRKYFGGGSGSKNFPGPWIGFPHPVGGSGGRKSGGFGGGFGGGGGGGGFSGGGGSFGGGGASGGW